MAVLQSPPKWHLIFAKGVRAVGDSELGPGRQVERVPMEGTKRQPGPPGGKQNRKALCQQPGPWRPGSRLHSVQRDSSWHQLQSGTMPGFLSFFFFLKKILIEGREELEPLIEQLSIMKASGTVCP